MKKILFLIITFSILSSCKQKNSDKKATNIESIKPETKRKSELKSLKSGPKIIYWQTDFDTIKNIQDIVIENEKHELILRTYSLNDSSIVSINGSTQGIYHDYASEIILLKHNDTILNQRITKNVFKDSLIEEFYELSVLTGIKYNGTHTNKLLFKGELNVPDTGWVIENKFEILFQTEDKNQINSWNYQDIGL